MAERRSRLARQAPPERVASPRTRGQHVPDPVAFEEHKMQNRRKTPNPARKVRNRSRNRINDCPEPAGNGHFVPPKRPQSAENAQNLPETGHFPIVFGFPEGPLRNHPTARSPTPHGRATIRAAK